MVTGGPARRRWHVTGVTTARCRASFVYVRIVTSQAAVAADWARHLCTTVVGVACIRWDRYWFGDRGGQRILVYPLESWPVRGDCRCRLCTYPHWQTSFRLTSGNCRSAGSSSVRPFSSDATTLWYTTE